MGELSLTIIFCAGATCQSTKRPQRSHPSRLQNLTGSQNPFHNKLPFLLRCSSLHSYHQGYVLCCQERPPDFPAPPPYQKDGFKDTAFQTTYTMGSICHSVWGPCCPCVGAVVQRSPPLCVCSEPSSPPAQAIPLPPSQHIMATQVNIAKDMLENFKKKINSYIYRFFPRPENTATII